MGGHDARPRYGWLDWVAPGVACGMALAALGLLVSGFFLSHAPFIVVAFGLAVAALGIGICASLRSARLKAGEQADRPTSAGPVIGCVVVAVGLFFLISIIAFRLFPSHEGDRARKVICLSNTKNIALAFQMYLEDNDDVFPPADTWCDALGDYVKHEDVFRCPEASDLPCAYAFNSALSGVRISDIADPDAVVALFESPRGWNGAGGPEALPAKPRHLGEDNYGLASGRAAWLKREDLAMGTAGIRWELQPAE